MTSQDLPSKDTKAKEEIAPVVPEKVVEPKKEEVKAEPVEEYNCKPCKGLGLKNQYAVCDVCKGTGKV